MELRHTTANCGPQVSVVLNEMNRSVGGSDAYPFTISAEIARKLELVDGIMGHLQKRQIG